jgi:hypothetical protein
VDPTWLDAVVLLTIGGSTCTGTFVAPEGKVLTAYHCVAGGLRVRVDTRDGRRGWGRTVAADPGHDLALVEVPALGPEAPVRELRTEPPALGERLWAIGHPFAAAATGPLEGTLRWSVTEGVASAVGSTFVQTDAALNPGNSGGPLVDAAGRIVGVVSRKLDADNLSFATRASLAQVLVDTRPPPPLLGGTWGLNARIVALRSQQVAGAGELALVVRERAWARLALGGALAGDPAPLAAASLGVRQRIGTGPLSTTVDLGGEVDVEAPDDPWVIGRVGLLGMGIGYRWATRSGAMGAELAFTLPLHGVW